MCDKNCVQQTAGSENTTYTLDLASGLTQVLADGENTYQYGLTRLAQLTTDTLITDYFLTDALGSARQLTDADGIVTLAQSYMPLRFHSGQAYGDILSSAGSAASSYGFTGEMTDPSGLIYLRARYYHPSMGRFLTQDPWDGDYNMPMSYNPWLYVYANPVNYIDPAGTNPLDDLVKKLRGITEECFNEGNLDCVWRNYYLLAVGGNILGYTHAADHLFQFLFKRGDINYEPFPPNSIIRSSYWVYSSNAVQTELPIRESEILNLIHSRAKSGDYEGFLETDKDSVYILNQDLDKDLYYAMNIFTLWAEANYEISGCYEVTVKPTYHFWDPYNWHTGLAAGGPAVGVSGFLDEWTAALHDAGMALEYEINGHWFGPAKVYTFPANWLELGITLPPISERPAPAR